MASKKEIFYNFRISNELDKEIKKYLKSQKYFTISEFIREAIREKIFGRTRKEEIENKTKKNTLKEDKYFFEENKKLFDKLKKIEKKN